MGLSFKKFRDDVFSGVRDVFDANTQADQQRRLNSGQAQFYQDQQRQQGRQPANNIFSQATTRVGNSLYRSPFGQTTRGAGALLEYASKQLPRASESNWLGRGVNDFVIDPIKTTDRNVGKLLQGDNPYTGSFRQQAGQASQDVINIGSVVPIGKAVSLARKGLPAIKSGASQGAKIGAGFGAAQGASTSLQNELGVSDSLKTIGASTGIGTVGGGVLGGAAPVLGTVGRATGKAAWKPIQRTLNRNINNLSVDLDKKLLTSPQVDVKKDIVEPELLKLRQEYQKAYDVETNPKRRSQINKGLADLNTQIRANIGKRPNLLEDQTGSIQLPGRGERNLSDSSPNNNMPPIPENVSPKTKNLIESIRAKEAPNITKGAPTTEDSLVKGAQAKASTVPEAEFQQAMMNSKPSATRKGNVGGYQYSIPEKGSSGTQYTDYLVNKYIEGNVEKPKVRAKYRPSRASTSVQELYRGGVVDPIRDAVNDLLQKGITSSNPIIAGTLNLPTLASNRFGLKDAIRTVLRAQKGQQENAGRVIRKITNDMGKDLAPESLERIDRVFEQEDYLGRAYGNSGKLSIDQLTPQERQAVETMVDVNKLRNDINLEIGNITPELHEKFANGMHSPRIYDLEVQASGGNPNLLDTNVSKKRVNVNDVSEDIFSKREASPIMRSMIRAEIALRDKATFDAMKGLRNTGLILDAPPNKSFTKLDGKRYGAFNGSYIYNPVRSELDNNIAYNTKGGQAAGDLVRAYQSTPLGTADRFFKATKTTLAPATFLGNVISNPVAFNPAAGVNTLTQAKNMAKASVKVVKDARGNFDRSLYEARKLGVGAGDTGKQLTGDKRQELQVKAKNSKNPYRIAGSVYGGVDQTAQVALYDELIARGLSPETAARRVMAGTQDYEGVGRLFQNMADTPVLGKPFARFAPEFARIVKNNAIYNPVGTAAKVGAVAYTANKLSELSGETEEERNARENAVGQTQIPGTGIINKAVTGRDANLSLNFAVPDKIGGVDLPGEGSAVNIARLTGFNNPMEPGGDAEGALARSLSPLSDITQKDAQGNDVIRPNQAVSSLTFRPLADQLANRDFMGREITDPTNKTYIEGVGEKGKKFSGQPTAKEQKDSRLQTLAASYIPGFNEANAVYSAAKGQKDYYGKERTLGEGIARAFGAKTESNTPEARKSRLEKQDYFEGKVESTNKFLRENPDLKEAYAQITSNTRTRGDIPVKVRDMISPEKWKIIVGEKSGRLFNRLKAEALESNKTFLDKDGNGAPIDPVFQVNSPERVKEITELRSRPTGDDIEREEILRATTSWYGKFEKSEKAYHEANKKFFNNLPPPKGDGTKPLDNPRVKSYADIPYTEQSELAKRYMELRYGNEEKGIAPNEEAGKQFYKNNKDQLSKDFDAYKVARLKEINAKRAIEGFSPIDQDTFNNVTFGFDEDEVGAFGARSGYGRGGSGQRSAGSIYKYAIDPDVGGNPRKPSISVKAPTKKAVKAKKYSQPKVSIKKSLV